MLTSLKRGLSCAWLLAIASGCGPEDPGGPKPTPECVSDSDCLVALPPQCQQVSCVAAQCVLTPKAVGTPCDDGLFCSVGDACDGHGACSAGRSPCNELAPGIPRCNELERQCEVCTDGRPLVNGECRCPFWNCQARGGATFCSETDQTEENTIGCFFDGLTLDEVARPSLVIGDHP